MIRLVLYVSAGIAATGIVGLLCHEAGHWLAMKLFGIRVLRIRLSPIGVGIEHEGGEPWQNLLVTLAGPAANIALAALAWTSFREFAVGNLGFGLVLLLYPDPRMDGWRAWAVLQSILAARVRNAA